MEIAGIFLEQLLQHSELALAPHSVRHVFVVEPPDLLELFFYGGRRFTVVAWSLGRGKLCKQQQARY
jgi:hypothetical protein